jgi:hypothetical protein
MRYLLLVPLLVVACAPAPDPDVNTPGGKTDDPGGRDAEGCEASAHPYGGGKGTAAEPYLVCSAAHLSAIGDGPGLHYFRLTRDLDLAGVRMRAISRFAGILDGAGHALIHLTADGSLPRGALFLEQAGLIHDLEIRDASVLGASILAANNSGVIDRCTVSGDLAPAPGPGGAIGAVAGYHAGVIARVQVRATVNSNTSAVGGIAGRTRPRSVIQDSHAEVEVIGGGIGAGGAVGVHEGLVQRTHVVGSAKMRSSVGRGAGGLVGNLQPGAVLADSSAQVSVYAYESAGGLVGRSRQGITLRSWATGEVTAESNAGGLLGLSEFGATFEDCWATASIKAHHSGTGVFAAAPQGEFRRCFASGHLEDVFNGARDVSRVVGNDQWRGRDVTVAALAQPETFTDFDPTLWQLDANTLAQEGHPRLAWQAQPPSAGDPGLVPVSFEVWAYGNESLPTRVRVRHPSSGRVVDAGFAADASGTRASTVAFVEPGPIEYQLIDAWDKACRITSNTSSGTGELISATAGPTGTVLRPWASCSYVDPMFVKRGPWLRRATPDELRGGVLLAEAGGHSYRLLDAHVIRDEAEDITPLGWELDDRVTYEHGGYLYFLINRPALKPGRRSNTMGGLHDPVAFLWTPILDLSKGTWRQDEGNWFNVAGLDDLKFENGRISGTWHTQSQWFHENQDLVAFLRNSHELR